MPLSDLSSNSLVQYCVIRVQHNSMNNAEQMLQRFVIFMKVAWEENRAKRSFKGSTSE